MIAMEEPTVDSSAAWAALLPEGAAWLPERDGGRRSSARLRHALRGLPPGSVRATPGARWGRGGGPRAAGAKAARTYLAFPSSRRPLLIASRDDAVLRYVATSVVSVPPGSGPVPTMVLTAGLRVLRRQAGWSLATLLGAVRVVLVGRSA